MDIIKNDILEVLESVDFAPLKGKRVLITGVNGLIGTYLLSAIHYANQTQKLNCKVTGVSLHGPNVTLKKFLPNKLITFKKADLSKKFKIDGKFDCIFHAAGYGQPAKFLDDPFSTVRINVDAALTLLEMARKSKGTFVFFSSAEIYGDIPESAGPIKETYLGSIDPVNPRAVYGEAKRLGESLTSSYARMYGVNAKILRISHLYGPGLSIHDSRVMSNFMRAGLLEKKIVTRDAGLAVKTFGYIGDATKMMFHIALHGREMVYHVGGKDTMSIRKLAETIGKATGASVTIPEEHKGAKAHTGIDPKFVGLSLARVTGEMKGFSFTLFAEGIQRTIDWNKEEFADEL
jgi:UDP-glucuronate decarboxylase